MKKIALILILITTIPTYATTMCTANDTVAVVIDPSINLSGWTFDAKSGTWSVWSSYGTIRGISACLNTKPGGTVAHLYDTDNNGNNHLVTGSEKYGHYCWCRFSHPVSSLWVFRYSDIGSGSPCTSYCARSCALTLTGDYTLFIAFLNSISK